MSKYLLGRLVWVLVLFVLNSYYFWFWWTTDISWLVRGPMVFLCLVTLSFCIGAVVVAFQIVVLDKQIEKYSRKRGE